MIMSASNCDVLVAGEYFCDLIFSGLDGAPRLGAEHFAAGLSIVPGGTYNIALAATRLGLATRWCCDFGSDIFSAHVLEQAHIDGLDQRGFRLIDGPLPRVSAAFSGNGERGFISYSAPEPRAPDTSCLHLHRPSWLLQTFRFEPDWIEFVHIARQQGASVFLDCRDGDFSLNTPRVRELLALADVFSPNAEEAMALAGTRDFDRAVAVLAERVPVLLVKRGPEGALLVTGKDSIALTPPPVDVVDTIGAGDAFNAGFVFGMVSGAGLAAATRLAVVCGALSTTGTGSRACPTAQELARLAPMPAGAWAIGPRRDRPAVTGMTT